MSTTHFRAICFSPFSSVFKEQKQIIHQKLQKKEHKPQKTYKTTIYKKIFTRHLY